MKPVEVRSQLIDALRLDLVGPENGSELEAEILPQAPSRWYLTGFLVPLEAGEVQKSDETANDDLDSPTAGGDATDDDAAPEPPAARRAFFPSSIGLSLCLSKSTRVATSGCMTVPIAFAPPRSRWLRSRSCREIRL
jgi:hypothetical protein